MNTFTELLDNLHIPTAPEGHHHTHEGWVQIDCPWCGKGSGSFHLGYKLSTGSLNCWRCGRKSLYDLLLELGIAKKDAYDLTRGIQPEHIVREKHQGRLILPYGVSPMLPAHKKYIQGRGLCPKELEKLWDVQGIGISASLSWRLFIPIYLDGVMVSWSTRSLGDHGQRYLAAKPEQEAVPHKSILYGEDYCRHAIIVVEGPADVWAVGPGSVGLFGTGFTLSQVQRISKYLVRVICLDNETEAQQQARALCDMLECFPGETHNIQLDAKDPGEASKKEIKYLRSFL